MNQFTADIPDFFQDDEKLTRIIFSPFHVDSKGKIKPEAFRPPFGKDEVSVNRINYTTADFCKGKAKAMQKEQAQYRGLASIQHKKVLETGAFARVSKLEDNPFHADIFFGSILLRGEPIASEMNLRFKELAKNSVYFADSNPDSLLWEGADITEC